MSAKKLHFSGGWMSYNIRGKDSAETAYKSLENEYNKIKRSRCKYKSAINTAKIISPQAYGACEIKYKNLTNKIRRRLAKIKNEYVCNDGGLSVSAWKDLYLADRDLMYLQINIEHFIRDALGVTIFRRYIRCGNIACIIFDNYYKKEEKNDELKY